MPVGTIFGEIALKIGVRLFTVKVTTVDVPPPGVELLTDSESEELAARADAGRFALTSLALTKVVGKAFPFQFTTDESTKLSPSTLRVIADDPAMTLAGVMVATTGSGLSTVNSDPADVPPSVAGFVTVSVNVPLTLKSDDGSVNWSELALM